MAKGLEEPEEPRSRQIRAGSEATGEENRADIDPDMVAEYSDAEAMERENATKMLP